MLTKLIQIVVFLCFSISCCLAKVSNIVVFGDSYSGKEQLSGEGKEEQWNSTHPSAFGENRRGEWTTVK
jgi:hypothetical protein